MIMAKFNLDTFRKHWIWAPVSFLVSAIITGGSYYLQYVGTRHDLGGFLNATFHSRTLNNKDSRTIVICVDDTTHNYQDLYITPTFDNPDEYSLRDFSLNFETVAEDVELIPSSFVKTYKTGSNSSLFKYDQDVLQAHMDTKNPFAGFKLKKDFARCEVISKVSFDGAESLFEYRTDIWFVYTPNKNNLSFDYWKLNCKQKVFNLIDDKAFDIYYVAKNEQPEYQFDVILSSNDNKGKEPVESQEKKTPVIDSKENIVKMSEISRAKAKANAGLDIEDFEIIPGENDTTFYRIYFNHPVKRDGNYILRYAEKNGWAVKVCFLKASLTAGAESCMMYRVSEYPKIANLTIYHQVDAKTYIEDVNNSGSEINFKTKNSSIIVGLNYSDSSYYVSELYGKLYEGKFEKPVEIELFDYPHQWIDKFFMDSEGIADYTILYAYLIGMFVFLGLIFLSLIFDVNDNLFAFSCWGMAISLALWFLFMIALILEYFPKAIFNYFYLVFQ